MRLRPGVLPIWDILNRLKDVVVKTEELPPILLQKLVQYKPETHLWHIYSSIPAIRLEIMLGHIGMLGLFLHEILRSNRRLS